MTDAYPRVQGECPMGCGRTLFLGEGGYVTCSYIPCPNPAAIDDWVHGARAFRDPQKLAALTGYALTEFSVLDLSKRTFFPDGSVVAVAGAR